MKANTKKQSAKAIKLALIRKAYYCEDARAALRAIYANEAKK